MNPFKVQIAQIEEKVDLLMKDYNDIARSAYELEKEKEQQAKVIEQQSKEIAKLKNTILILKKSQGSDLEQEEKKELNKVLNEYIREIDKCITKLSD